MNIPWGQPNFENKSSRLHMTRKFQPGCRISPSHPQSSASRHGVQTNDMQHEEISSPEANDLRPCCRCCKVYYQYISIGCFHVLALAGKEVCLLIGTTCKSSKPQRERERERRSHEHDICYELLLILCLECHAEQVDIRNPIRNMSRRLETCSKSMLAEIASQ